MAPGIETIIMAMIRTGKPGEAPMATKEMADQTMHPVRIRPHWRLSMSTKGPPPQTHDPGACLSYGKEACYLKVAEAHSRSDGRHESR